MRCPRCGRTQTGQVGGHEYYCWNCCVEFHGAPGAWKLFDVDEEGGLMEIVEGQPDPEVADVAAVGAQPQPVP